jgi:hypothetical protein
MDICYNFDSAGCQLRETPQGGIQQRRQIMRYLVVDIMAVVMMLMVSYGIFLRFHSG